MELAPDGQPEAFEGQCQCGAVRYRVVGTAVTLFACHCTECQLQSASAFGMALWVQDADVRLLDGVPKVWLRSLPSGRTMTCQFCPDCGARLFHKVSGQDRLMSIKPGTLQHTLQLRPVGHIWTRSKQAGVQIPEGTLQYEGNPPSFDALFSAWTQAKSRVPR